MIKLNYWLIVILASICLCLPQTSWARSQTHIVPDGGKYEHGTYDLSDIEGMAVTVARGILGLSGAAALAMFVWGGLQMILAVGNSESFKKGQQTLTSALVGLVIIFSSYMIIDFTLKVLNADNSVREKIDAELKTKK